MATVTAMTDVALVLVGEALLVFVALIAQHVATNTNASGSTSDDGDSSDPRGK